MNLQTVLEKNKKGISLICMEQGQDKQNLHISNQKMSCLNINTAIVLVTNM